MAYTASVSSKGQVVIPAALRKQFKLGPRSKVVFGVQDGKLTIQSLVLDEILALCGKYRGAPLEEYLAESRQKDEEKLEALYVLARDHGFEEAARDLRSLGRCVESVPVSDEDAEAAALLKHRYKLGLSDTYAAGLALRLNATLVTANPEFAKLGKQPKILALPRHVG